MNIVINAILAIQMLAAIAMIGLILIQHGKGADMGAAFGSGSSGSLFGASGSANFLSRTTAVLAAVFFACTLALAYFGNLRTGSSGSVLEQPAAAVVPATPASAPASAAHEQIPGATDAAATAAPVQAAPAVPASAATGAEQIPTK